MDKGIRKDLIEGKYKPVDIRFENFKGMGFGAYFMFAFVSKLKLLKERVNILIEQVKYLRYKIQEDQFNNSYAGEYSYQKWLEGHPVPIIQQYPDQDKIRKEQEAAYQKHLHDGFQVMKGSFLDYYELSVLPDKYLDYEIKEIQSRLIQIDFENYFPPEEKEGWNSRDLGWNLTREQVEQYISFNYEREITGWSDEATDLFEEVAIKEDHIYGEEPTYLAYIVNYKFEVVRFGFTVDLQV